MTIVLKMAMAEEGLGDVQDASAHYLEAADLYKLAGEKHHVPMCLNNLAMLRKLSGDLEKASLLLSRARRSYPPPCRHPPQRCDPAPFYLFDEIDAALDPQYRTAVAAMVRAQADAGTQFVCTTFRPELVKVARVIQGVERAHKGSRVREVALAEALNFVVDEHILEEGKSGKRRAEDDDDEEEEDEDDDEEEEEEEEEYE